MNQSRCYFFLFSMLWFLPQVATMGFGQSNQVVTKETPGKLLFEDDFDREEQDDTKEQIGKNWGTNSKSRAAGNKQVDLHEGALKIERHKVADHGVSVFQDVDFRNAVIELRFKLGENDNLGVNIADMKEPSVHAGHLFITRVRLKRVEITDLKTGRMNLKIRENRLSGKPSKAISELIRSKSKLFDVDLTAMEWHQLRIQIDGEELQVTIDGHPVGSFRSPGIGHPTKRRLRLAVGKSAFVDDVRIWQMH